MPVLQICRSFFWLRTEVIATSAYRQFSTVSTIGYAAVLTMVLAALDLVVPLVTIRLREPAEA